MLRNTIIVIACLLTISFDTARSVTAPAPLPEPQKSILRVVYDKEGMISLIEQIAQEKAVSADYGKVYTLDEISPIVKNASSKYGVSFDRMMYTLYAESHFSNVQSSCHKSEVSNCDKSGIREESYGIAQFHISTLEKEKALNVYVAVEMMAYYFSIGEECRWTEYRKKYGCNK